MIIAGSFSGDPFWDPVEFRLSLFLILAAVCLLLTIAFVVWTVLQPEEPEMDTKKLVDEATSRDRGRAAMIRRRMDADTGRTDANAPELR